MNNRQNQSTEPPVHIEVWVQAEHKRIRDFVTFWLAAAMYRLAEGKKQ